MPKPATCIIVFAMTAPRTRKEVKAYDLHQKFVEPPAAGCAFCQINEGSSQLVKQTKAFKVIRNIFPYSLWDGQVVRDHLMVIPVMHTDSLADLPAGDAKEFLTIISSYETLGYSVYARAPASTMKSLAHQHTHLIKCGPEKIRGLFFVRKPYIRFLVK